MKGFIGVAGVVAVVALLVGCVTERPMRTTIHKEGDRVVLEGVNGWFVGDKGSSVHAAQEAVMRAVGEDVTYDYLVGVSGLAFRMQVSKNGLCPSSPHSACGYNCTKRAVEALPWEARAYEVTKEDVAKVKEARRAVMASIDRGVPVLYGSEEDGVIIGYQKGGDEWLCFDALVQGGQKMIVKKSWPWGIGIYTARKAHDPDRRALVIGSLRQAVDMANAQEADAYFVGFKAWDKYIEKLKALDAADEKTRNDSMQGNAWIYECLGQYRGCAARYLRGVASEFDAPAAEHLRKAADLYAKMSSEVLVDPKNCPLTIAPYPFSLKPGQTWTAEMRQEQVKRLQAALPIERQALAEIGQALASIDSAEKK